MKKTLKLKKNYEFNYIFKKGKYFSGEVIECFYLKDSKKVNYMGIAINSKLCNAVRINMIKIIIRESYLQIEEKIKTGNTFVFLWKKKVNIEKGSYENIEKDMNCLIKKMGIVDNEKNND